ncbi:MAG: hypothetical protein JWL82_297 [Parcubacteria group bacterium]|nr:hypothetical protein [Parcubacteria group bacterium]
MNKPILIAFVVLVLIGGGYFAWTRMNAAAPLPASMASSTPVTTTSPQPVPYQNEIVVVSPTSGQAISSPLTVSGRARGSWYFEASFPILVRNAAGTVIGQGTGAAQGDWMTVDFVPFTGSISYTAQPAGSVGTVVFKNDNPSGDPANDKQVVVPIIF